MRPKFPGNILSESVQNAQAPLRREAVPGRYLVGSLLNSLPGFGLGYLVTGHRRLFRVSLLVWMAPGAVLMVGLAGDARCPRDPYDMFSRLVPWGFLIFGGALGVLVVNLFTTIHLFVLGASKLKSR